jgi:hypothetical protein
LSDLNFRRIDDRRATLLPAFTTHQENSGGSIEFNLQQSRAGRRGHVKRPV